MHFFCPKLTTLEVGLWPIFEAVSKWPIWLSHSHVNRERKAQMFAKSWIVMDWIPEIGWVPEINQKWVFQNKLNKSILLRIFLPDFEKRPNMLTIWQKDEVFNFPEKPISIWQFEIPKNRNPNFRYPIVINHDLDVYVTITFTTTCSGY